MMQGLYTSTSGMKTHSQGLGVVSQNIANVNTLGFKKQLLLFDSLGSKDLPAGAAYEMEVRQVGYGSQIGEIRSLFTPGSFENGNASTDLALSGKGFFQVTNSENETFYTRAGNFRFNHEGTLQTPTGEFLMGYPINEDGVEGGGLEPITINTNDPEIAVSKPKATTDIFAALNVYSKIDGYNDENNPYFSMLQSWDGTVKPPLNNAESISLQFYDEKGTKHSLQVYVDQAPSTNGLQVYEYVVAMDPELDGREEYAGKKSAGLLMAGTMTFSSAGELKDMNAFSPEGDDLTDLTNWKLADLENGTPKVEIKLKDQEPQTISLNFGIKGTGWTANAQGAQAVQSPADIGKDFINLPNLAGIELGTPTTTALQTTCSLKNMKQDGYGKGDLASLTVRDNGTVQLLYNNGVTRDMYRIPIARFTSEDGLHREGNNLYVHSPEAGDVEFGIAGTENYSKIHSNKLELSNVDMATEMVHMILVQRGFQSNSKGVQSIDTMIQKAIEMKR